MKNFLRLIFAALLALGIAACNKEVKPAPVGDNLGKTYVTFTVQFPSTRASSTDETGDSNSDADPEIEVGRNRENTISTVQLVLLECTDGPADTMTDKVVAVSSEQPIASNGNQYTVAFKSEDLQAAAGDSPRKIRVIAYCNHTSRLVVGNTLEDAYNETVGAEVFAPQQGVGFREHPWKPDAFWMTNADREPWDSAEKLLPSQSDLSGHNTVDNALDLGAIEVERTAARFDYAAGVNQVFPVVKDEEGNVLVSIELTDLGMFNISRDCYKLRRVSPDGTATDWKLFGKETPRNYVVDTDWQGKTSLIDGFPPVLKPIESIKQQTVLPPDWEDNVYYPIDYGVENTLPADVSPVENFATGVMFRGKIEASATFSIHEDMDARKVIYVLDRDDNPLLLGSWERITQADDPFVIQLKNRVLAAYVAQGGSVTGDLPDGDGIQSSEWTAAAESVGLVQYKPEDNGEYPVYYPYYIRHNDNHNPEVHGPMEFAVVRNNVYKIKVNKITGFGYNEPKPVDPEPINAYFKVTLTVLPWVVRLNDDIELK